ncbi:RNA polymerase sigma factor [Streptomyces althioticus]|uniref:RNA polymerase sigma factor n=1 Tax=Streptomyces TaxID=1883 RepID=UPI0033F9111E
MVVRPVDRRNKPDRERRRPERGPAVGLEQLIQQCRAGDVRAWERLIRLYSPAVWTVVRSHGLGHADCEDAYQLTWQRLVEHIHTLKQPGRIAAWLVTVAKREALARARQSRRVVSVPEPADLVRAADPEHAMPAPEERVLARADGERLQAVLEDLPEQQRELLGLLFAEPPLSYDHISQTLGIARGSIGPTRRRILAKLHGELVGQE